MEWVFLVVTVIVIISSFLLIGFKKSLKIFFLPNKEDAGVLAERIAKTGTAAILYEVYHYAIAMIVAASIVVTLKSLGCQFWTIVSVMWIVNALNGLLILKINDRSGIDLTLYAGTRRMVDALTIKKNIVGILSEIFFVIKLVLWDGPGELVIFLRPRIVSKELIVAIFLVSSLVQMIPWVMIYLKGYDSLSQFFLN